MKIAELDDGETVEFSWEAGQGNIYTDQARVIRFHDGGVGANGNGACSGGKLEEAASGRRTGGQ